MKILYIGQYSTGTTSRMRADKLQSILKPQFFDIIDTHIPFFDTNKIFRSLGFRYKKGPLIWNLNLYVQEHLKDLIYDMIWVDKGIFLNKRSILKVREHAKKLIHFTPDMAFYANKSSYFERSLPYYDFLISTKTMEKGRYLEWIAENKLIITTQGYDKDIHKNFTAIDDKKEAISFVGLCESHRKQVIQKLINSNVKVLLAGKGWTNFVKKNKNNPYLEFYGEGLFSLEYSKFISSTKFSLGLLSKRFPELHTTRTFEIPACGTALLTERNQETELFFKEDEVVFYHSIEDLLNKVNFFFKHSNDLEKVIQKGCNRVDESGYDYASILSKICKKILLC